jgi:GNAT superfamily N-acetyltransferase
MEGFSIRAGSVGDIDALVTAYAWLFAPPGSPPPSWSEATARERLGRWLAGPATTILVATVDRRIVGFCTIALDIESVRFGRRAWVEDLAVDPARRSQGIGRALLDEAKSWARAHGAARLALDTGEARVDAHRFYERERPSYRSRSYGWWLE